MYIISLIILVGILYISFNYRSNEGFTLIQAFRGARKAMSRGKRNLRKKRESIQKGYIRNMKNSFRKNIM